MQPAMIIRRLTADFTLLRNNAVQSRHFYVDPSAEDEIELMGKSDKTEVSLGPPTSTNEQQYLSSDWLSSVDEIQFEISRIKTKLKELSVIHDRHVTRPSLDESGQEERAIDTLTQEVTRMLSRTQSNVQQLEQRMKQRRPSKAASQLSNNVVSALAKQLQQLALTFSQQQNSFLDELRKRDERHKQFLFGSADADYELVKLTDSNGATDDERTGETQPLTRAQKQALLTQDLEELREREKQIDRISKSIVELNSVFKEVALLVVEQGTVLDRIDCNLEKSENSVEEGLRQLQKAEKHSQRNRKMLFIIALAGGVFVLLVILIFVKIIF